MASVIYNDRPRNPDVVVDETWFADPDFCEKINVCAFANVIVPIISNCSYCFKKKILWYKRCEIPLRMSMGRFYCLYPNVDVKLKLNILKQFNHFVIVVYL